MAASAGMVAQAETEILALLADGEWHRGGVASRWGVAGRHAVARLIRSGAVEKSGATVSIRYRLAPGAGAAPAPAPDAGPQSLRSAVLAEVGAQVTTGSVGLTEAVRRRLGRGVELHEVQHVLADLQRAGLLTYTEVKTGPGTKKYTNIRLSKHAVAYLESRRAALAASPEPPVDDAAEAAGEEPVMGIGTAVLEADTAPDTGGADVSADPADDGVELSLDKSAVDSLVTRVLAASVEDELADVVGERFPLLRRIVMRRDNIRRAAALLEAAGLDDEALRILDLPVSQTPLEAEYLAFASLDHRIEYRGEEHYFSLAQPEGGRS